MRPHDFRRIDVAPQPLRKTFFNSLLEAREGVVPVDMSDFPRPVGRPQNRQRIAAGKMAPVVL